MVAVMGRRTRFRPPERRGAKTRNFGARGRRKPLKRLKTAKEIKGSQSFFLCWIWLDIGSALLDLAKFGIGLAKPPPKAPVYHGLSV
jgi:hypothetical protein